MLTGLRWLLPSALALFLFSPHLSSGDEASLPPAPEPESLDFYLEAPDSIVAHELDYSRGTLQGEHRGRYLRNYPTVGVPHRLSADEVKQLVRLLRDDRTMTNGWRPCAPFADFVLELYRDGKAGVLELSYHGAEWRFARKLKTAYGAFPAFWDDFAEFGRRLFPAHSLSRPCGPGL